jgi:hypothetical protein
MRMEDLGHSEVEVEHDLEDFQNSCTIEDPQPDDHSDIYEPLSRSEDDITTSPNHRVSPMVSDNTSPYQHHAPDTVAVAPPVSAKGGRSLGTVEPERFYHSPSTQQQYGKKKRKAQSGTKSPGTDVDPNERDEIEIIDNVPK